MDCISRKGMSIAESMLKGRSACRVWVPLPPAQYVAYLFREEPSSDLPTQAVLPHDELDASDTEVSPASHQT